MAYALIATKAVLTVLLFLTERFEVMFVLEQIFDDDKLLIEDYTWHANCQRWINYLFSANELDHNLVAGEAVLAHIISILATTKEAPFCIRADTRAATIVVYALVGVNTFLAVLVELETSIARTNRLLPYRLAVVLAVPIVSKARIFQLAIAPVFRKNIAFFAVALEAVFV